VPFGNDGTFSEDLLVERTNSDLANILGNLVNRTISMSKKYFDGKVLDSNETEDIDKDLIDLVLSTKDKVDKNMDELKIPESLDAVFDIFRRCNKYIDETTPWILSKEGKDNRLKKVLYNLLESIRIGAVLLSPYLPDTSKGIFDQLNTDKTGIDTINEFGGLEINSTLNDPTPLFMRIEKKEN